jgi:hypothetical protein
VSAPEAHEQRSAARQAEIERARNAPDGDIDLLAVAPGLIRLAAQAGVRTAAWSLSNSLKAGALVLRMASRPDRAPEYVNEAAELVKDQIRRALGVTDLQERVDEMPDPRANGRGESIAALKERGAELLARSADVGADDEYAHPAYERIITSLAPDEARILRLMAIEGARAAVDVRTWRPLDVGSETIEPGLTMIGQEAGLRHLDRVPAYLNNLYRLGLIWFSREALDDQSAYQVLEAQPDVLNAMRRAGRAKTIRRSIRLTPFGIDFCETCLPLDTAGFMAVQRKLSNGHATQNPGTAPPG